jgi:DUF2950 family protein
VPAAADAVAVVAVVAAAVAGVVAAGAGRREEPTMIVIMKDTRSMLRRAMVAMAALAVVAMNPAAAADKAKQKTFASPEEAAKAVIAAAKAGDSKEIAAIFGTGSEKVLQSGDKVADKDARERFAKAAEEANALEKSGDAKAILTVGKDKWPFPVPIVKADSGWRFDLEAGKEEILNRRIGRNELFTVQSVLAYADAQREYYTRNPDNSKLLHYAQKMASSPGKRDGLYFPVKAGEPASPLGPLFDAAKAAGYAKGADGKPAPYHGYKYKILTGQGPDAKGGAYDYIAGGKMIGGFAVIAWPATYGNSGVMTFMVNHDGVVYEKDLGPGTEAAAQKIKKFNPDKSWKVAEEPGKK